MPVVAIVVVVVVVIKVVRGVARSRASPLVLHAEIGVSVAVDMLLLLLLLLHDSDTVAIVVVVVTNVAIDWIEEDVAAQRFPREPLLEHVHVALHVFDVGHLVLDAGAQRLVRGEIQIVYDQIVVIALRWLLLRVRGRRGRSYVGGDRVVLMYN